MSPHASEASSAAGYVTLRAPSPMREPTTLHEILDSMDPSDPLSSVSSFPQEAAYEDELPSETTSTGGGDATFCRSSAGATRVARRLSGCRSCSVWGASTVRVRLA